MSTLEVSAPPVLPPVIPSPPAASPTSPVTQLNPDESAWHRQRRLGIGGSDAASLFNEGWGCERRLVYDKRGVAPDYQHTEDEEGTLERGSELEDAVARKFGRLTGLIIEDSDGRVVRNQLRRQPARISKSHPHARVNMDRQLVGVTRAQLIAITIDRFPEFAAAIEAMPGEIGTGFLECKTTAPFRFAQMKKDGLPVDHIFQAQHTLGVTGYRWGFFAVMNPLRWNDLIFFPFLRDEPLIAAILDRAEQVWNQFIAGDDTQPVPSPAFAPDKRCKSCLWRKTCRGAETIAELAKVEGKLSDYALVGDAQLAELCADLKAARAAKESAEEVEKAVSDAVKQFIREHNLATMLNVEGIATIRWNQVAGKRTWDSKALEGELAGLNLGKSPVFLEASVLIGELQEQGQQQLADRLNDLLVRLAKGLAERLSHCRKQTAPSQPFYFVPV